jgi:preprotein translocase subunit SecG
LKITYVGIILFIALGLVLNMLFNEPEKENKVET